MLPFLAKKKQQATGIATVYRAPDETKESPEDNQAGLEAAADDLMRGVHSHDKKLVVSAMQAMFEILDAMPHVEGPHEEESELE